MLNYLQGTPAEIGRKKRSKSQRREERKKKKEERKTKPRKVAKIALVPARASFLAAVRLNALKLAKRLAQAYRKDRSRVETMWLRMGGKPDELKKAIEHGAKTSLGVVTVAAATALAAPIIVAVVKIFKDLKSDQPGDDTGDGQFLTDAQRELQNDPTIDKDIANMPDGVNAGLTKGDEDNDTGGGLPSWVLPVGLGAGALLVLPKMMKG